jgi:hypothetical protein
MATHNMCHRSWLFPTFETSCAAGAPLLMRLYTTSEDTAGEPIDVL